MNNKGFTLIELMVATVIISIVVIGLITSIAKGTELNLSDLHRRRARSVIDSVLESQEYSEGNIKNFGNSSFTTLINPRDVLVTDDILGTVVVSVTDDSLTGSLAIQIPYREVTVLVFWSETDYIDTVVITKRVSEL